MQNLPRPQNLQQNLQNSRSCNTRTSISNFGQEQLSSEKTNPAMLLNPPQNLQNPRDMDAIPASIFAIFASAIPAHPPAIPATPSFLSCRSGR